MKHIKATIIALAAIGIAFFWYLAGAPFPGRYQIVGDGSKMKPITVIDTVTGRIIEPKTYTLEELKEQDPGNDYCRALVEEILPEKGERQTLALFNCLVREQKRWEKIDARLKR
jgi:hypothetical protein